jgi:MFS family permease
VRRYLELLRNRPFAALWTGSTISAIGDAMTWVSLIWLVFSISGSAKQVSVLVIVYTAPTLVGGLVMGSVLDRFDRRATLVTVNSFLCLAVVTVPVLHQLGWLHVWNLYVVAALYGFLKMTNWAGVPALVPSIVAGEDLNTANAMESISFGLSDVAGPAIGGILIGLMGAANVLAVDAASYALFVAFLLRLRIPPAAASEEVAHDARGSRDLRPAFRFMVQSPAVFATTLMYMSLNVGEGMLFVLLPFYASKVLHGSASVYGSLLSAFAFAALVGATVVGAVSWRPTLGRSIAAAQTLGGLAFLGLVFAKTLPETLLVLAVVGLCMSPLTIWAQTIRMRLIPAGMRGRVFGVLRTLMQSTPPIGAAIAGVLLSHGTTTPTVLVMVALMAIPGVIGLGIPALADEHTHERPIVDQARETVT